jgi:phosphatidate cytidylyltransferase
VLFSVLVTLILFLALLEFNRMGLGEQRRSDQWLSAFCGAGLIFSLHQQRFDLFLLLLTVALLLISLKSLFSLPKPDLNQIIPQLGWLGLGLLYLPLLLGHLVLLRQLSDGTAWVFMTLLAVMTCDSFALFFGMKFGKRKLYPAVSPNKSIEGGLGGLVGAVVAVVLMKLTFLPQIGYLEAMVLGLLLGCAGQIGDLFESLLKRGCGVKDSGTLIPGHGGLLDRLDSLLFAFPLSYYAARYWFGS